MLRLVSDLTAWAEAVSKSQTLQAAAPRVDDLEVSSLTTSFKSLTAQLAEQNRELKRKQYELKTHNVHLGTMSFSDALTVTPLDRECFPWAQGLTRCRHTLRKESVFVPRHRPNPMRYALSSYFVTTARNA